MYPVQIRHFTITVQRIHDAEKEFCEVFNEGVQTIKSGMIKLLSSIIDPFLLVKHDKISDVARHLC